MIGDWVCEEVDELVEAVGVLDEVDGIRLFCGPEVLPASTVRVQRSREHLVQVGEEVRKTRVRIGDECMVVIAHRDPAVQCDAETLRGFGEAVQVDLLDRLVGAEQELALRAATADEIGATADDLARLRHAAAESTLRAKKARSDFEALLRRGPGTGQKGPARWATR
jgi:hypothetical protein